MLEGSTRLGCDPVQLERLAAAYRSGSRQLELVAARVARIDRRVWSGPASARWRDQVDRDVRPLIRSASDGLAAASRRALAHAEGQRRASLHEPARSTTRLQHGGDGRWVGRTGSPDAEVVVVLLPGVGTDLTDRRRLQVDADRVWARLTANATRSDRLGVSGVDGVAVVSWLGYDPPDLLIGGLDRRPARAGAAQLVADVAGLRRDGAERVVVVGHSYGGLVASLAASRGMPVDELVLLGSPGLGVGDAASLHLPRGAEMWAASAERDPVGALAGLGLLHGADPLDGAVRLATSLTGHSSYLRDPVLLDALAELTLGPSRG